MTRVTARWRVSRAALDRTMPGVIAPGKAHHHALLEITLHRDGDSWSTLARLLDPKLETAHTLDSPGAEVRVTRSGSHTHVEASGLLSISFRDGARGAVYAQTPVLQRLGVPGGRYELDSASIK